MKRTRTKENVFKNFTPKQAKEIREYKYPHRLITVYNAVNKILDSGEVVSMRKLNRITKYRKNNLRVTLSNLNRILN